MCRDVFGNLDHRLCDSVQDEPPLRSGSHRVNLHVPIGDENLISIALKLLGYRDKLEKSSTTLKVHQIQQRQGGFEPKPNDSRDVIMKPA
jgi:hypothetical protein